MSYGILQDGVLGDPAELSEEYHRGIAQEQAHREFIAGLICSQLLGCELSELDDNHREDYLKLADEIMALYLNPSTDSVAELISRVQYGKSLSELDDHPSSQLRPRLFTLAQLILQKTGN